MPLIVDIVLVVVALAGVIFALASARRAARMRQAQAEAENAARLSLLGALAASIAHEVNQPLAVINANASAGLQWLDASAAVSTKDMREILQEIEVASERASTVIQRTLDLFSRQPAGRSPIHLGELVEAALTATEPALRRAGVTVSTDVPAQLPHVHADRGMMLQVLVSLISNALDAMHPAKGGALALDSIYGPDGLVHLAVEDTGPGVDPQKAEALFQPFHSSKPGHIGIGLTISRAIVEAHGGVLRAVPGSRPGARFQISLPPVREGGAGVSDGARRA